MPYDPTKPAFGSPDSSAEMRGQLAWLKELIDAGTITDAVVDAVNTVAPGNPANVTASLVGGVLHLTFDIPQGAEGAQGQPGNNGSDGQQGQPGQNGNDGQPGEVTNAALAAAIATTSSNSNSLDTLNTPFADPDMESLRQAHNALVLVLRR